MARIDFDPQSTGPRKSGRVGFLTGVLVLAVIAAAAGYFLGRRAPTPVPSSASSTPVPAQVPAPVPPAAPGAPAATASGAPATANPPAVPAPPAPGATPVAVPPTAVPAAPTPGTAPVASGPRRISASLSGPFEETVTGALGPGSQALGAELTQVSNRLLVWDLQVAKDGRKGDKIEILFAPAPPGGGASGSQEPIVEALRFTSQKRGKTFAAYRWQAPGAKYPRYYRADGSEVEERLVDGPIRDYEQVTSLVKDGRRHKGVDFRTPVGTPVYAPFDGMVERRNWKFAANGNCLDLVDPLSGRHAIFLHLDVVPKTMQKGRMVKKGEQIAVSGNSGHSFAPHLHYQIEDQGGRVLDPFAVHKTRRDAIPAADLPAFQAQRARLDAMLSAGAAL
jgi:murein DD-endopeptidase